MKDLTDKELIELYEKITEFIKSLESNKEGAQNDQWYSKSNWRH